MTTIEWKTEKRKVKELKPFLGNPRTITKEAIEKVKDRIRKRGFHDVLKIDSDDTLLSGHIRQEALIQLGIEEVDVKVPNRRLTKTERDAVVLESNRNDGEWDQELLGEFEGETLLEVGFESTEVDSLKEEDEDEEDPFDPEEIAAAIKKPKTQPGDMYRLGEHILLCGDSTKKDDIDRLIGGVKADMVFTDPPYNMNYRSAVKGSIMNDNLEEEAFLEFSQKFVDRLSEASKVGAVFYICTGYQSLTAFMFSLRNAGMKLQTPIVWVKNTLGIGNSDYRPSHETIVKTANKTLMKKSRRMKIEPIIYGWKNGQHYFPDTRSEGDVWNFNRRSTNTMVHPTQKPLALINKAIKNSSKRGEIILDLFGGSGSTLVAAHKTGRRAFIMEMDSKYVDVIVKRYEALTGDKAQKI